MLRDHVPLAFCTSGTIFCIWSSVYGKVDTLEVITSKVSMLVYFMVKFRLRTQDLTYATMHQDPHEFIINTKWKIATLKINRKQRPVVPVKTASMRSRRNQLKKRWPMYQ